MPVEDLPDEVVIYLLGSRYCETDRLSEIAWSLFGGHAARLGAGAGDLRLRPRPHQLRLHARPARPRPPTTPGRRATGVCRDYAHLAIAFCRCMNIPARYCTGYLGDIGVPVVGRDGLQRLVRGLPRRPLVRLRRAQQHAAHGPRADRPRPRRRRRAIANTFGVANLVKFEVTSEECAGRGVEGGGREVGALPDPGRRRSGAERNWSGRRDFQLSTPTLAKSVPVVSTVTQRHVR